RHQPVAGHHVLRVAGSGRGQDAEQLGRAGPQVHLLVELRQIAGDGVRLWIGHAFSAVSADADNAIVTRPFWLNTSAESTRAASTIQPNPLVSGFQSGGTAADTATV